MTAAHERLGLTNRNRHVMVCHSIRGGALIHVRAPHMPCLQCRQRYDTSGPLARAACRIGSGGGRPERHRVCHHSSSPDKTTAGLAPRIEATPNPLVLRLRPGAGTLDTVVVEWRVQAALHAADGKGLFTLLAQSLPVAAPAEATPSPTGRAR